MKNIAPENIVYCKGGYPGQISLNTITYLKANPANTENMRKEYVKIKPEFVKLCATCGILDSALTLEELKKAAKFGVLPERLSIHHMVPLGGSGKNDFSMLKILPKDFHNLIHYVYEKMISKIYIGDTIELPDMGMKIEQVYYPKVTPEAFVACKLYAPEAVRLLDNKKFDFPSNLFHPKKQERKAIHNTLQFIGGYNEISFNREEDLPVGRLLQFVKFLELEHVY